MKSAAAWSIALLGLIVPVAGAQEAAPKPVSYYQQVRPIFQAHCLGCHQPGKEEGDYNMTTHAGLLGVSESGVSPILPGNSEESYILGQVTVVDGKAFMPPGGRTPLSAAEIALIRRWIDEGAKDDTPASANRQYDAEHPPVYSRPPILTALDYSPDGSLIAVGGFHEVLLWKADGSERVARLIGLSERIEAVKFSPNGKYLAVVGGLPGRMGEVQIWNVAERELRTSQPVTFDTIYGASWSPDGTRIAFGCGDNSVRAIDAKTGQQVLFMGSHNDWVLDTTFSNDGNHLISVGRDMTAKLTEVATQRFVDNITSITPGALKGGLAAVARIPTRDEILVGGSDGAPKLYRIHRETPRVIGDDANAIGSFEAMPGRIFGIALSADGKRFAAVSSLDASGQLDIYDYTFDVAQAPEGVQKIHAKAGPTRSPQERADLDKARRESVKRVASVKISSPIYAVAMSPDGKQVAAGGGDGVIRLFNAADGVPIREFSPAPTGGTPPERPSPVASAVSQPAESESAEVLPEGVTLASIEVQPTSIFLRSKYASTQLVVTGKTAGGDRIDVTRLTTYAPSDGLVSASKHGRILPKADGQGALKVSVGALSAEIPVKVTGQAGGRRVDYVQDVAPILSRLGCNAGTCHGSAQGKNGFKLSLRGYDPIFDLRALTDDHGGRRINLASADDSLMLMKPSGGVPHVGGVVMGPGEPYYEILRGWIADGCKLDLGVPRVNKLEVFPPQAALDRVGSKQQLRVVATFADGETRDVTREAFLESGNTEVATVDRNGLLTSIRRGEAPVLIRYEGNYAASTITVMGDRSGFVWQDPPKFNAVDGYTAAKWQRLKIQPSELCTDAEFIRRVSIDLTGVPPRPPT
ncbi:MAG: c-type cytochrome domain-containing protein [Isosphaeraceae bacterium]